MPDLAALSSVDWILPTLPMSFVGAESTRALPRGSTSRTSRITTMLYSEFRAAIQEYLQGCRERSTWRDLRDALALPYERPCPEWTRRLEREIGLARRGTFGRALV